MFINDDQSQLIISTLKSVFQVFAMGRFRGAFLQFIDILEETEF